MRKANILLLILLCLLIGLAIYMIFRLENANKAPETSAAADTASPAPTATPVPTATPEPTAVPETPTPTPAPTATPATTAVPTPTASPTASPTPTPAYEMSGTFRSDTGTWFNLVVHWQIVTMDGQRKLMLTAYAESYSLITVKRLNDVEFIVDGETSYASSGPIDLDSPTVLVETELGSAIMNVTSGRDASVRVKWHFIGTIAGRDFDVVSAEAAIPIP